MDALYNSAELKTCFCHAWSDIYKCVNILYTTVHVLRVYACVCCVSMCVCVCVCNDVQRCVWWNLHHTNSERLKYGLCQTWSVLPPIRELLYILGPQRLNRASRHDDVPSGRPIWITLLVTTTTTTTHGSETNNPWPYTTSRTRSD